KGTFGGNDNAVWATDVDTLVSKEIAKIPAHTSVSTVNADETLLAGTYIEGEGGGYYGTQRSAPAGNQTQNLEQSRSKGQMMEERPAAHLPMGLFVIDVKSGKLTTIHRSTDWLNHLEFSPTAPSLLMFCHE